MDERHARTADEARQRIARGAHDRFGFRAALLAVPFDQRDAWVDRVLGLGALPDDGAELPPGCVPYLPCSVDLLIEAVDRAAIGPADVFVDVGSGVGRAMAVVHLLSGAAAVGVEIQSELVAAARAVSPHITTVRGDAVDVIDRLRGDVFFFYAPFSGERLERVLGALAGIARTKPIRVCCVDLPLPACAWLVEVSTSGGLTVYRSAE